MAGSSQKCDPHALRTLSSLKIANEYSYVLGRLDTLEKIFHNGCFNHKLGLKMLQLGQHWNYEFNNDFIKMVIEDLENNKPIYAVFDNSLGGTDTEDQFTSNFTSANIDDKRPYTMYLLEMSQILAIKDITVELDNQKTATAGLPNVLFYKIQKQTYNTDFTTSMKRSVNKLLAPPMDMPRVTAALGRPRHSHVGAGSDPAAPKVLLAGRWRNRHTISIGKRKTLVVVRYNGVYVPVSFVEHVSKR